MLKHVLQAALVAVVASAAACADLKENAQVSGDVFGQELQAKSVIFIPDFEDGRNTVRVLISEEEDLCKKLQQGAPLQKGINLLLEVRAADEGAQVQADDRVDVGASDEARGAAEASLANGQCDAANTMRGTAGHIELDTLSEGESSGQFEVVFSRDVPGAGIELGHLSGRFTAIRCSVPEPTARRCP